MKEKSIIQQMYLCNRGNYEEIPLSKKYFQLLDDACRAMDEFSKDFSPEQKKAFNDLYALLCYQHGEECHCNFVEGVKFGLLMGIEAAE